MKLVTAAQMQALDRRTIEELGLPGMVLMETAGRAVVEAMQRCFSLSGARVLVICGKGNNGGDGFVIARHLAERGVQVETALLAKCEELDGDARTNAGIWLRLGYPLLEIPNDQSLPQLAGPLERADYIVDAIFGTGLQRPAGGHYALVIGKINAAGKPVAAVDIPSGLLSNSGTIPGPAIQAALTVTFALPKWVHYLQPAAELCGEVIVADIGIPGKFVQEAQIGVELLDASCLEPLRRKRHPADHKGSFGHLLIVAGSPGKTGAAILAAKAALRMGAGLVTVGVPRSLNPIFEAAVTEAMSLPLPETASGCLAEAAADEIIQFLDRATALALGPGLSTDPQTASLVKRLAGRRLRPAVIDADGLNILAPCLNLLQASTPAAPVIFTPHPGEMARLSGKSTREIQADRLGAARDFARMHQLYLLLKGAGSVIAFPDGALRVNTTGNPGMATGGSGDVLTGMIGGLLAQGLPPAAALPAAVYLHGLAGDCAILNRPEWNLTAGDLIEFIGEAMMQARYRSPY